MWRKLNMFLFTQLKKTVIYPDLKINNIIIDRVAQFNFLGLIISSDLKWHKHIDHISLKISKVIRIMYRIKSILQANILLTMYNALIMPHFNYCLLAWGSNIKAGHKLHLLQKIYNNLIVKYQLCLNKLFSVSVSVSVIQPVNLKIVLYVYVL